MCRQTSDHLDRHPELPRPSDHICGAPAERATASQPFKRPFIADGRAVAVPYIRSSSSPRNTLLAACRHSSPRPLLLLRRDFWCAPPPSVAAWMVTVLPLLLPFPLMLQPLLRLSSLLPAVASPRPARFPCPRPRSQPPPMPPALRQAHLLDRDDGTATSCLTAGVVPPGFAYRSWCSSAASCCSCCTR
jgi:hypothetical protein